MKFERYSLAPAKYYRSSKNKILTKNAVLVDDKKAERDSIEKCLLA
jgi:hypothetical protein